MDWIKVTPDTMPKEREEVFVNIKHKSGAKFSIPGVFWTGDCWANLSFPIRDFKVTHWMPYPAPAED